MNKILVSACLLGDPVRYDGKSKPIYHTFFSEWLRLDLLVKLCPEMCGGLPTPRPPAEIQPNRLVKTAQNKDVTSFFVQGAQQALSTCLTNNIKIAILKEGSPSCGSTYVYDGSFTKNKVTGEGLTTKLLRENGIAVYSEHQIEDASAHFEQLNNFKQFNIRE